jgi:hypothetical protein
MRAEGALAPARRVRDALPHGHALPEPLWSARHRGILTLLWIQAVALWAFALLQGYDLLHAALEVGLVVAAAGAASVPRLSRRIRSVVATAGLFTCSALLVHFSGGVTEMHFHFFVMVVVVALYQDWVAFLVGIGYVLLHHGVFGTIAPEDVYGTAEAIADPWGWAAIHAAFILAASVACLVAWKRSEEYADELSEQGRRRKEALELNDHVVQGLVVAQASFELGDDEGGRKALDATLARAKALVSELLADDAADAVVRREAAAVKQR